MRLKEYFVTARTYFKRSELQFLKVKGVVKWAPGTQTEAEL